MPRALIDTDSLEELAAEGKRMPLERLKQLEAELPLTHDEGHDTGVFDALVYSMNLLPENEPTWIVLREKAAAAAAHVVLYRAVHLSMYGETGTPEFWVAVQENFDGFVTGRVPTISAEEVRMKLEACVAEATAKGPKQ